jgi:hypothetical protein
MGSSTIHDSDAARKLRCMPVEHGQEVVLERLGVGRDAKADPGAARVDNRSAGLHPAMHDVSLVRS